MLSVLNLNYLTFIQYIHYIFSTCVLSDLVKRFQCLIGLVQLKLNKCVVYKFCAVAKLMNEF